VSGNRAYLIEIDSALTSITLQGEVGFFRPTWTPDRFNLIGFGIDGPTTFDQFFGPSGGRHPVGKIYALNSSNGNWGLVNGSDPVLSGHAYWIFSSGASRYMGPVAVDFDSSVTGRLDFAGPADAVTVDVSPDDEELDLEELVFTNLAASGSPAIPQLDLIAPDPGSGSLDLFAVNRATTRIGYDLGNQIDSSVGGGASAALGESVAPESSAVLTIGARRNWSGGALARTNLYRLKTGGGSEFWMPVRAVNSSLPVTPDLTAGGNLSATSGLWIGEVTVNAVSSITENGSPMNRSAGSAPIRVLLHSDGSGAVTLLSQVTMMQTKSADPGVPPIPALVVDPARVPFYEGVRERNGRKVGIRIEAAAYDLPRKLDGESQAALLGDPSFLGLTSLASNLQDALGTDPLNRTPAQDTLIQSSSAAIDAAILDIPNLLPGYLLSRSLRPPALVDTYDLGLAMDGAVGAGKTVRTSSTAPFVLDPFHRSNPFRHAFHQMHARGQQIEREWVLTFDADQAIADRLRGTFSETLKGLIKEDLKLSGTIEMHRVSRVSTLEL
ncbi:MAG: hypothetical protein ACR2RV_23380, partial [Verrucomicrobiales bacterium]